MPRVKPSNINSLVIVDKDVYPDLYAILEGKPKNQRSEFLRVLAAEALAIRARLAPQRSRREPVTGSEMPGSDTPAVASGQPASASIPTKETAAPPSAPVPAPPPRSSASAIGLVAPAGPPAAAANPASALPLRTLTG